MLICRDQRTGEGCGTANSDNAQYCSQCGRSLYRASRTQNPNTIITSARASYRIHTMIGHGGFGAVYEAEVVHHPTVRVALKETFEPAQVRDFQSEFIVLRTLNHDNLPRYYDMFEAGGRGYLVMELVPGLSLDAIVRRREGPVLELLVLQYADQICEVLAYLHGQQPPIIHRDIKPANIRLTPEGLIKLVDFGLFKQGTQVTQPPTPRAGTLAYAPYEQWIGGTDQRSDIYSLGATLYHLLTGKRPLPAAQRQGRTPDPLPPPRKINSRLSPYVDAMILKTMHLQREQRFATIAEVHDAVMWVKAKTRGTKPLGATAPLGATMPLRLTQPEPGGTGYNSGSLPRIDPPSVYLVPEAIAPPRLDSVTVIAMWQAHYDVVNAVAWSPDGRMLASASNDGRVLLWRLKADGFPAASQSLMAGTGSVFCLAWSPDGRMLASGGKDHLLRLWRVDDGALLASYAAHTGSILDVAWSPDGNMLASASWDQTVRLWQVNSGSLCALFSGHTQSVNGVAWKPDAPILASASADGTLRLWDVRGAALLHSLAGHTHAVKGVAWSADGQYIASASADTTVRLWRASDGAAIGILHGHKQPVSSVAWSPDSYFLASGGVDCMVRLWHMSDTTLSATLTGHTAPITGIAWSPDGCMLASTGDDRTIRLWRVQYSNIYEQD